MTSTEIAYLSWLVWNIVFSIHLMKIYDVLRELLNELRKDGDTDER